jgi:hypothetical protein
MAWVSFRKSNTDLQLEKCKHESVSKRNENVEVSRRLLKIPTWAQRSRWLHEGNAVCYSPRWPQIQNSKRKVLKQQQPFVSSGITSSERYQILFSTCGGTGDLVKHGGLPFRAAAYSKHDAPSDLETFGSNCRKVVAQTCYGMQCSYTVAHTFDAEHKWFRDFLLQFLEENEFSGCLRDRNTCKARDNWSDTIAEYRIRFHKLYEYVGKCKAGTTKER